MFRRKPTLISLNLLRILRCLLRFHSLLSLLVHLLHDRRLVRYGTQELVSALLSPLILFMLDDSHDMEWVVEVIDMNLRESLLWLLWRFMNFFELTMILDATLTSCSHWTC